MRFRDVLGRFPGPSRVYGTDRRRAGYLASSQAAGAAGRTFALGARVSAPHLVSPTEQVVLDMPAQRARRLVRLQIASIVVVSIVAGLLGMLCVTLPSGDRSLPLAALAVVVTVGGLFVGLTEYVHGRCVNVLIQTASQWRQSAAERAADLARINAELRRRDAERASLFATMSHELRTPLSAMIGFSRALLDDVDGELNDEQRADVAQVHQSANGLLGIVNRTLDFALLDAGGVTVKPGPVQVYSIVDEVIASLRPLAAARGLVLDCSIQPSLPPAEADDACLRQVLVNLVGNAIKFTDAGHVDVRVEAPGGRVTVAVSDTGIGIARAEQALIFEPFRQVNSGTVRGSGGAGLGLAICQRLVQLMGGRIWVESEPGAGSTFFVSLPAAQLRAVMAPTPTRAGAGSDVVVVGDAARTGPFVASLRSRGLEVKLVCGPNWSHALAATAARLVLFDVLLARSEAWRGLAELRAARGDRERVIGLVGLVDGGGRIAVPVDLDVLTDADLDVALAARTQALRSPLDREGTSANGRVCVISADMTWRRRVSAVLEARGIRTAEASHAAEAVSVARRVPMCGLVVDLLIPDPGFADLLGKLETDEILRRLPLLIVGPGALSPRQQHDLRRDLVRWARERPVPVSELAGSVADVMDSLSRETVAT
jgi:signal transduction histidine kinase/CheY-like chemotaxis protein